MNAMMSGSFAGLDHRLLRIVIADSNDLKLMFGQIVDEFSRFPDSVAGESVQMKIDGGTGGQDGSGCHGKSSPLKQ